MHGDTAGLNETQRRRASVCLCPQIGRRYTLVWPTNAPGHGVRRYSSPMGGVHQPS